LTFPSCLPPSNSLSLSLSLTGVHSAKTHKLVRILYDTRKQYLEKLEDLALPTQRSFEISLTHGTRAAVQILFPPSWREELRDAAFPVLVEV
jgi:inactive dipeptidyl peptidase 10